MSVLPRDVLLQLLPNIHLEPPTQVAQAFGGEQLLLEGPYHLMVTICQYTFCHPFYHDCRQGYVWSYYTRGTSTSGDPPTPTDNNCSNHTSPKYRVSTLDSTVTASSSHAGTVIALSHTGCYRYSPVASTVTASSLHTGTVTASSSHTGCYRYANYV